MRESYGHCSAARAAETLAEPGHSRNEPHRSPSQAAPRSEPPAAPGTSRTARRARPPRHVALGALLILCSWTPGTAAQQDSLRSTRAGVYTVGQGARGGTLYAIACANCHRPATHTGAAFAAKWEGKPLADLFEFVRATMPKGDPGSLTRREYILVLAYLLKINGMPAGAQELPADSLELRKIRLDLKPTADPAPER